MQGANKLKFNKRKRLPASLLLSLFFVVLVQSLTATNLSASLVPKITSFAKHRITSEHFSEYLQRTTSYTEDGLLAGQTIDSAIGQTHRSYGTDWGRSLLLNLPA